MAMNKREQALMEELQIKASLHLSTGVKPGPDIPVPSREDGLVKGWSYNQHRGEANRTCSTCIGHNSWNDKETTSQKGIAQYSTELLALKSMRYDMELKFAKELRKVDLLMAEENQNETT